jgi:glycosyltransferase involved in cell wall biosynthesis
MLGLRGPGGRGGGVEGGVEAHVAALAPRLARRGFDVTVYCRRKYNPVGDHVLDGVRLVNTATFYGRSTEALSHTALAIGRASRDNDLVHLHACGPALFSPVARLAGRRAVVTLHGADWERDKWGPAARTVLRLGAWIGKRAPDRVVVVSRDMLPPPGSARAARTCFLPNGVDTFQPVAWDPAPFPGLRPGRYALFLGRLVPEKGIDTLLQAVATARPSFTLAIAGGAAYTDDYVARLHRDAPPGVVFTGPRFGVEKRMLLAHACAFLFPSRLEGMPVALLEALAAGLPVAASEIPANTEVLGPLGGWRLPVDDPMAWAAALREIDRADPALLRALGTAGRAHVREHYDWDAVADGTAALYREILGQPAEATASCA